MTDASGGDSLSTSLSYIRTDEERYEIGRFFGSDDVLVAGPLKADEDQHVADLLVWVDGKFNNVGRYVLGLTIDFLRLADVVDGGESSDFEPSLTGDDVLKRYPRREHHNGKTSDTLTISDAHGGWHGIRGIEEDVYSLFQRLLRTDYPSAAPHNTKAWRNNLPLLGRTFALSRMGRRRAVEALVDYGLSAMTKSQAYQGVARTRIFPLVVEEYLRGVKGENGGVVYQGIAYGYFKADRPHLSVVAHGSKTGGSRANMIGDVEGYYGASLEFTAEVKDLDLTGANVEKELRAFVTKVGLRNVRGIVVAKSFNDDAAAILASGNVFMVSQEDLMSQIDLWDYAKQDVALNGLLHYLSHVESSVAATSRLAGFIRSKDPEHPSLAHLRETEAMPGTK